MTLNPEETGILLFMIGLGLGIVVGYISALVRHRI